MFEKEASSKGAVYFRTDEFEWQYSLNSRAIVDRTASSKKILARRMLKDDVNSSFPVVLCHVLNYALGYCVVDVFYSDSRGEVEIHYHFQRFRLLKEARINVQAR